jgi:hypothetical protein
MKKTKFILFFVVFIGLTFPIMGKEFIVFRSRPHGMFSIFHYVLFYLQQYDRDGISGLHIDFEDKGFYYDEHMGSNWWEYYFEPILLGEKNNENIRIIDEYNYFNPDEIEFVNSLEDNHQLIQKYIKIKPHILKKVNDFQQNNFDDHFVIGIHFRGTDKVIYEAKKVEYCEVITCVDEVLSTLPEKSHYKIFVATDERQLLDYIIDHYGNKVCFCEANRSFDGMPIHMDKSRNPFQIGKEAVIDALLLSRVNFLIRTSSNLSLCSRYFAPKLPVIELSQRNPETIPCRDFYP